MDQLKQAMTTALLGSGDIPEDLRNAPLPIAPLRVSSARHYVFARTMVMKTSSIESSGLNLEEVIVGDQVYRVSRAVIGNRHEGPMRILTAHTPSANGRSRCTVVATRRSPWTPEVAVTAIRHSWGGIYEIGDGIWHPAKVTRISEGGKPGLFELMDSASNETDTFTIVGHTVSGARAESKMAVLEAALADYPWLINASLYVDPTKLRTMRQRTGHAPERWINGFFATHAYLLSLDTADIIAELGANPAPVDLHTETVRTWVKQMAVARCSFRWPHRPFVHALVEHFGDWLRGSRSTPRPTTTVVPEPSEIERRSIKLQELQHQLTETKSQLEAQTARAEQASQELHASEDRVTRLEADVTRLEADVKQLRKERDDALHHVKDLERDLHKAHGDLSHEAETCEGSQDGLTAPRRWDELFYCAQQLTNISLTEAAVEPAIRKFGHHQRSSMILSNAWHALRALNAWMAAPAGERGPLELFLTEHPQAGLPPQRVARGENEKVANTSSAQKARTFATAFDDDYREMTAHIRLSNGQNSGYARLHYCEDPELDVVHVGYIGPHLPG